MAKLRYEPLNPGTFYTVAGAVAFLERWGFITTRSANTAIGGYRPPTPEAIAPTNTLTKIAY